MSAPWMIAVLTLWLVVCVLIALVYGLLRRLSPLLEDLADSPPSAPTGLPVGERVPKFVGESADGSYVSESDFAGRFWVVLFLSAGCGPCAALVRELLESPLRGLPAELVLIVDSDDLVQEVIGTHGRVIRQDNGELSRAFRITGIPYALVISDEGVVVGGSGLNSVAQLDALVRTSTARSERIPDPKLAVVARSTAGEEVSVSGG